MAADTIFALSSGFGVSAVAVIRVSGPATSTVCRSIAGCLPPARHARLSALRDRDGRPLDQALVLWFPAPNSFTGEDCLEIHAHGGRAVIAALLMELGRFEGLRPAHAGEFTRRAFLNGKMDLTSVEGLADLLAAETDLQRAQALAQAGGVLRRLYDAWRRRLIDVSAMVAAEIDFVDEEDVPGDLMVRIAAPIRDLIDEMREHLAGSVWAERVREGFTVVIAGPPNAGKSTLMNALSGRDAAIVSETAGTTRDVVEVHLDLNGIPVTLVDTAGIRETSDQIEGEGIRRARDRAETADLVLWLSETCDESGLEFMSMPSDRIVRVHTKSDVAQSYPLGSGWLSISADRNNGIDDLVACLQKRLGMTDSPERASISMTRERHRVAVLEAADALAASLKVDLQHSPELVGEELRIATTALARLTGRVDVEDLLDVVFSEFCIGK